MLCSWVRRVAITTSFFPQEYEGVKLSTISRGIRLEGTPGTRLGVQTEAFFLHLNRWPAEVAKCSSSLHLSIHFAVYIPSLHRNLHLFLLVYFLDYLRSITRMNIRTHMTGTRGFHSMMDGWLSLFTSGIQTKFASAKGSVTRVQITNHQ